MKNTSNSPKNIPGSSLPQPIKPGGNSFSLPNYNSVPYRDRPMWAIPPHLRGFYPNASKEPPPRDPRGIGTTGPESLGTTYWQQAGHSNQADYWDAMGRPDISDKFRGITHPLNESVSSNTKPGKYNTFTPEPAPPPPPTSRPTPPPNNSKPKPPNAQPGKPTGPVNDPSKGEYWEFPNQEAERSYLAGDKKIQPGSGLSVWQRLTNKQYGELMIAAAQGNGAAERELKERERKGQKYIMDSASAQRLKAMGPPDDIPRISKPAKPQPGPLTNAQADFLNLPRPIAQAKPAGGGGGGGFIDEEGRFRSIGGGGAPAPTQAKPKPSGMTIATTKEEFDPSVHKGWKINENSGMQ
jgi:hypothetical protein